MGRFTQWLNSNLPRTGRMIKESGGFINEADGHELFRQSDVTSMSRDSTLYRGFWQGTIAGGTVEEFVIDVPAGVDMFGIVRTSQVEDESVRTEFLSCTGFVSAEGPIDGLSLDRRTGKKSVSQCKIHRASSLSGVIVHSPEIALSVQTATATRLPTVQTEAGAQPAFDVNELPAFRYTNDTGGDARLALYLFWQELATV